MSDNSRLGFLGASDFGPLLGLSRFKTPHRLFLEKTEQVEPEPQSFSQELGHLLEPVVLELFARRKGVQVLPSVRLEHPTLPWLRAQLDGLATVDGLLSVVEAKHAAIKRDEGWGRDGSADVPGGYFAQVQVQMFVQRAWACANRAGGVLVERAFVPCLFLNGKTFNVFEVPYDLTMAEAIVKRGEEFWNRVLAREWPEEERAA